MVLQIMNGKELLLGFEMWFTCISFTTRGTDMTVDRMLDVRK